MTGHDRAPTVELHRHFEAGLRPETIARLAHKNGVTTVTTRAGAVVPGVHPQDPDSIRRYYDDVARAFSGPGGFERFIDSFGLPLSVLCSLEDLESAACDQIRDLAAMGALHTELRGSPVSYQERVRASVDEIISAIAAGVARAFDEHGASGAYIASFSRQNALEPSGPPARRQAPVVVDAVARLHNAERPIGIDIAGFPEIDHPPARFAAVLAPAREAGVPLTIHCGEQGAPPDFADAPPALVQEAIERLGVRRIGHGTCLIASPTVRALVAARGIGVECCPTSNRRMGFWPAAGPHPWRTFVDEGLLTTVSTDDPLMFGTFTVDDVLRAESVADTDAIRLRLARNGIATAFVSETRRAWLTARLDAGKSRGGLGSAIVGAPIDAARE